MIAFVTLAAIALAMAAEARRSRRLERALLARGAREPSGDVYRQMQVAYPASFLAMALEGGLTGVAPSTGFLVGAAVLVVAKGLKYWAIATLGNRWTFRVLVPPDASFVRSGPYRWMAHPNYVAVVGELVGMALMMSAWMTGSLAIVGFGALIMRRVAVENRALGPRTPGSIIGG